MTTAVAATPGLAPAEASPARKGGRDLRARILEFLVVGGATLFLFPISWLLRAVFGLDAAELGVSFTAFYAAWVINDPHFTVTYLLFYKDARQKAFDPSIARTQRMKWVVCGVLVPVALGAWAAAAIAFRSPQTLGWMIQLMYLLVGWHYVKQGFGVLAVLSARRGVPLGARERRVLLFHCFAGWAFAWANPAMPAADFEEKGVVYRALAHPRSLEIVTGIVLAASVAAVVVVLAQKWRRERRLVPLAPLAGLLVTIWSWTIFSSIDPLLRYVIPGLHSLQYLYFVWLLKRNEARASEGPPNFGRPVVVRLGVLALAALGLGMFAFHLFPTFLDTAFVTRVHGVVSVDEVLGETPFFAALFVILNVHHYFMDHVIWRRENPDTRWLRA